jgi:integrase/recombinase XerD
MPQTVARVATELLNDSNLASLTRKSYQGVLTPFVAEYGRNFIDKVQRAQIETYLQSLTGINFRTHNRHHTIIKRLFSFAAERGYTTHNPASFIKRKKPLLSQGEHGSDEAVRYLRKPELAALYRRSTRNLRLHALITLLHESGARIAEVFALNTTSIDFKNCQFQVVGKGNKKRWCYFGEASTTALKSYFQKRDGTHEALFSERLAKSARVRRLSYATAYREWKEITENHPTLRSAGFHNLRHTFATERAKIVPLEVLRALLGHENIQTTLIYQKITSEVAREEAQKALEAVRQMR